MFLHAAIRFSCRYVNYSYVDLDILLLALNAKPSSTIPVVCLCTWYSVWNGIHNGSYLPKLRHSNRYLSRKQTLPAGKQCVQYLTWWLSLDTTSRPALKKQIPWRYKTYSAKSVRSQSRVLVVSSVRSLFLLGSRNASEF